MGVPYAALEFVLFPLRETKAPARGAQESGLGANSLPLAHSPKVSLGLNARAIPFSVCLLQCYVIIKDHSGEWVRFSHRNDVLSGLGMDLPLNAS